MTAPSFDPGFSTEEMAALLSPSARVEALCRFEASLALASADHGLVPVGVAQQIADACADPLLDPEALLAEGWSRGTPLLVLLDRLRSRLDADAATYLHQGATTQDAVDTAMMVQLSTALSLIRADLVRTALALRALAVGQARLAEAEAPQAERKARHREKSERAALSCLAACQAALATMQKVGPAGVGWATPRELHLALRDDAALVRDATLRDHVLACAEVAFVAGFDEEQMSREGLSPGLARLGLRRIASATRGALVAYLAERDPGDWYWDDDAAGKDERRGLPTAGEAGAWIRDRARRDPR